MEITTRRTGEQLVLVLTGRMDGNGAQEVTSAIQQNLTDHDRVLIFDLSGVDYLSSAGLRVFQENARVMKQRSGTIAVCGVQDFVKKLFTVGGFYRILAEYPTAGDAIAATAAAPATAGGITITGSGWTLTAPSLSRSEGSLFVYGSLSQVYSGEISAGNIREATPSPGQFFSGIGAMATTREAAAPLAGEMVRSKGTVYWIPTDGHSNPDFFLAKDLGTSGMKTFTLFGAEFAGPFASVIRISSDRPEGLTLAEVYTAIFRYLREQTPAYSGICAVVLKATVVGLCSSDLKTSLLAAADGKTGRPPFPMPGGHTATEYPFERTALERASVVDVRAKYAGEMLISIGYGIERTRAHQTFSPESLALVSYTDPRAPESALFLFNKGVVYRNLKWDNAKPFEEQVSSAPASGTFVAVHNLLPITTVRSAVAGILPVTEIRSR